MIRLLILVLVVQAADNEWTIEHDQQQQQDDDEEYDESPISVILEEYHPPSRLPDRLLEQLINATLMNASMFSSSSSASPSSSSGSVGRKCHDPNYAQLADQFARFVLKGMHRVDMMLVPLVGNRLVSSSQYKHHGHHHFNYHPHHPQVFRGRLIPPRTGN